MTAKRKSQAEFDGRKALWLVKFIADELAKDEEGNANDFLDAVVERLDTAGFLADARSARPRTALPTSERAAAALRAVRDIAHTLRDPDEPVSSSDFVNGVARRLDAAGFLAEGPEPIKRRIYVDGVPQVEDGLFVASSEADAIATWRDKRGRSDLARSRLMAKKPCAKCGGPIMHPQLAGDASELCQNCAPPGTGKDTGATPAIPTAEYRCWVRARNPYFYREWTVSRRKDAVKEVRRMVVEKGGEGCVESQDPDKPFETYWAMVDGKIVKTAFY
jgi:hypothetical protein